MPGTMENVNESYFRGRSSDRALVVKDDRNTVDAISRIIREISHVYSGGDSGHDCLEAIFGAQAKMINLINQSLVYAFWSEVY